MNIKEKALLQRQIMRAKGLTERNLACRVGGDRHHWTEVRPDFEVRGTAQAIAHQCERCDCIKRMIIAPQTGEILRRDYEHPTGYLLKQEAVYERLMSPAAVRIALLQRDRELGPMRSIVRVS